MSASGSGFSCGVKLGAACGTSLALFLPWLGEAGFSAEVAAGRWSGSAKAFARREIAARWASCIAGAGSRAAEGFSVAEGLAITKAGFSAEITAWRTGIAAFAGGKFATGRSVGTTSEWTAFTVACAGATTVGERLTERLLVTEGRLAVAEAGLAEGSAAGTSS